MNIGSINRSTEVGQRHWPNSVPPFDPKARDRIEQVATKLLELNATLEARIVALEQRMTDYEDALRELGMVQVPTNG